MTLFGFSWSLGNATACFLGSGAPTAGGGATVSDPLGVPLAVTSGTGFSGQTHMPNRITPIITMETTTTIRHALIDDGVAAAIHGVANKGCKQKLASTMSKRTFRTTLFLPATK